MSVYWMKRRAENVQVGKETHCAELMDSINGTVAYLYHRHLIVRHATQAQRAQRVPQLSRTPCVLRPRYTCATDR
jgi:hypothetical protein